MPKCVILNKCRVMLYQQESLIRIFLPNQNYEIGWHIVHLNQIKLFFEKLIAEDDSII